MSTRALTWLLCAAVLLTCATAFRRRPDTSRREGCSGGGGDAETLRNVEEKVTALWRSLLHPDPRGEPLRAACAMEPNRAQAADSQIPVRGVVLFHQKSVLEPLEMALRLEGFPRERRLHGIHVHAHGEIAPGCEAAGPHFNPHEAHHGSHPGDFGNFQPDAQGRVQQLLPRLQATLYGPDSIVGRSIVVHEGEDDLGRGEDEGSRLHGNSGRRIACCVIGMASGATWEQHSRP